MSRPQPLFDAPDPARRALSRLYTALAYRCAPGATARYATIKVNPPGPCDECAANQHEAPKTAPIRTQAKVRRSLGGTVLWLCHAHEALWRERDGRDRAVT